MSDVHVGQDRATIESARLVRGRGNHVGDLSMPGMLEVAMVHSPHAHARIVSVDIEAARRAPGVLAVLTGADVARESNPVVTTAAAARPPLPMPVHGLAVDKARFAGEAVAAVAATSRALAEAAARLVEVTYEVLTPVVTIDQALDPELPAVHEGLGGNVIMHRHYDFGDVDGAFATAAHVVSRRITWPRQTGSPMETFGCVAQWKPEGPNVEFWSNHHSFALISSLGPTLGLQPQDVRAHAMDIGGSFGGKFWVPRPMVVTALLSKMTGRPVRYVEDRIENLEAGENHGEDRVYDAELALDADGVMTGLRFTVMEDYGASFILGPVGISEPLAQIVGPYRIQAVGVDFTALVTNKTAQSAYRGFGTAAQNFMLERLVDAAADELGRDPIELRRHNFIATEDFPYRTPTGNVYDSGDYFATLDLAIEKADIATWRRRQAEARLEGRAIGIGIATCNERSVQGGSALWLMFDQDLDRATTIAETVTCRIDATGRVRIALHSPSLGTSPETVAATVAAEELGIPVEHVVVSRLTSDVSGPALGPSASRLTVMLAGAVSGAIKALVERLRPLAARRLNTLPGLVRWDRTTASYVATDDPSSSVGLAALALEANTAGMNLPDGMSSGLETTFTFDHPFST
ncbi:MAG: xanthine dehydrogenase family protein, partial [Aeromicrobium sp.]